jgi:hypothetical protein
MKQKNYFHHKTDPNNEEPIEPYPIGINADPNLRPENKKTVFSKLKQASKTNHSEFIN